jgi:hypothetical protein
MKNESAGWLVAAVVVAAALAVTGCGGASEGERAYRAGRFDVASAAYIRAIDSSGPDASPELLYDAALATLRAGSDMAVVEKLTMAAKAHGSPDVVALCDFLEGNAAWARGQLAKRQATGPEAEPFAFDWAVKQARKARDAWVRAAATRDDWPQARRNVERSLLEIDLLERMKADAERNRKSGRTPGGEPTPRPAPAQPREDAPDLQPPEPPPAAAGDTGEPAAAEAQTAELSPDEVRRLLDRLAQKEREKLALRRARRAQGQADVERDW